MPIFFQHTTPDHQLILWEIQETESFFTAAIPEFGHMQPPDHPQRRLQFWVGRFLLMQLMPDFPIGSIKVAESGRPYLGDDSLYFSISHTDGFAAAIVSRNQAVGIDVERLSDQPKRVRSKFLIEKEEGILFKSMGSVGYTEHQVYTLAWSVKEAAFKALHQTGVDFIRDLPIESVDSRESDWQLIVGGKGTGLRVQTRVTDVLCLGWCCRPLDGR